jgi:hypothetical protein
MVNGFLSTVLKSNFPYLIHVPEKITLLKLIFQDVKSPPPLENLGWGGAFLLEIR